MKLHLSSFEEQKKLQMESITVSAKLNDKRQRELIIANIKFNKIESIIQELIILNGLNTERFNIIRTYNQYNHIRKNWDKKIIAERERRKLFRYLHSLKKIRLSGKTINISKKKIRKLNTTQLDIEKALPIRNNYNSSCNDLLDKETEKRNEIRVSSAKIKSEGIFVNLDIELDSFRGYQARVLELFHDLIVEDVKDEESFLTLIEVYEDDFLKRSNAAIRICTDKLNRELNYFLIS